MWNLKFLDTDKPLYIAIAEAIETDIKNGTLSPGEKLPTHRDLAKKAGVNVTTATRAYNEAEKRGFITSIVGSGTFVTSDLGGNPSLIDVENKSAGLIEMGLVWPLYSAEPDISPIFQKILANKKINSLVQYTPPQGLAQHRRTGANWVKQFGVQTDENNVIVTAGAQHAINCVLSACFESGDCIAVDHLTYPGIKSAAKRYGVKLAGITADREGMVPSELEACCKRSNIKGIYTASCLQNPTNATMSEKRKIELADIIEKENLLLFEDDLYRFLNCSPSPALASFVPEKSIYISSLSKAFYAGLRIAFTVSPAHYYNRICQAVVDTICMAPAINAEIACECIGNGLAEKIFQLKREEIRKCFSIFTDRFAHYEYEYKPDNMFVWLKLPGDWNSLRFERAAREKGVNVIASDKFTVGNIALPNYVRISLSGAGDIYEFEKGLDILSGILKNGNDEIVNVI